MCVVVSSSEYSKLLRHPEWQKMKTRVQIRADFKCEHPGCDYPLDENNHLNVHHTYYENGLEPWEHPIESLQCLCERHHKEAHVMMRKQPALNLDDPDTQSSLNAVDWKMPTGFRDGLNTRCYKNGQKYYEHIYKDGKLVTAVAWKPNGEKCPVTNVVNGNGVWVWYNDDGTESFRTTYKDGVKVD